MESFFSSLKRSLTGLLTPSKQKDMEERLQLALQAAKSGIWSWSIASDIVVWDEQMHHLFGIKPNTFQGNYEAFIKLVHPEDRVRVENTVKTAVDKKSEYEMDFRVMHPDK